MDMGFNQKQAVAILYAISGVLGLAAVVLTSSGEIRAMLLILAVIVCFAIAAKILFGGDRGHHEQTKEEPEEQEPDRQKEDKQHAI